MECFLIQISIQNIQRIFNTKKSQKFKNVGLTKFNTKFFSRFKKQNLFFEIIFHLEKFLFHLE